MDNQIRISHIQRMDKEEISNEDFNHELRHIHSLYLSFQEMISC